MTSALGFWNKVEDLATTVTSRLAKPFRAVATSVNDNGVQIQTYGSDAPLGERYAKLRGPAVNEGDEVAVIPYGGTNLVLGAVGGLTSDDIRTYVRTSRLATISSTTSTSNVTGHTFSLDLPEGSWEISGLAGLTGWGSIVWLPQINGVGGSGHWWISTEPRSTVLSLLTRTHTGSVEVTFGFRTQTAGATANISDPWCTLYARRVA